MSVTAEVTAIGIAEPSGGGPPPLQTPRSGTGHRCDLPISSDGAWDLVWELREDTPYDLAFEGNGNLLVATGNKGRSTACPRAVSADAGRPRQRPAGHLDPVRARRAHAPRDVQPELLRLSAVRAERGTYTSDVRRADRRGLGHHSLAGSGSGGTRVEISTRSGNTRTPDETWSDWAPAYANQSGSTITSPRAGICSGGRSSPVPRANRRC